MKRSNVCMLASLVLFLIPRQELVAQSARKHKDAKTPVRMTVEQSQESFDYDSFQEEEWRNGEVCIAIDRLGSDSFKPFNRILLQSADGDIIVDQMGLVMSPELKKQSGDIVTGKIEVSTAKDGSRNAVLHATAFAVSSFSYADEFTDYITDGLLGEKGAGQKELQELSALYWTDDTINQVYEDRFMLDKTGTEVTVRASLLEATGDHWEEKIQVDLFVAGRKLNPIRFTGTGIKSIDVADANFDGYMDILIARDTGGSGGRGYDLHVYDPAARQFVATDEWLWNTSFYPERKLLVNETRMGATGVECKYELFQWKKGSLVHIADITAVEHPDSWSDSYKSWLVSYIDQNGKRESKEIPHAFDMFSESERQPYLRFLGSLRKRLRSALR